MEKLIVASKTVLMNTDELYSTLLVITSILSAVSEHFLTSNHSDNHMLLKMGVIRSGKQAKPTLSTKLRQLSLWALINVMNCNYI